MPTINRPAITTSARPLQVTTWAEKKANDFQWAKDTIDFYARAAMSNIFQEKTYRERLELYRMYNMMIKEEYYHEVTNPLGTSKDEYKNFPARIKPYPILRSKIDFLLGEYSKRPFIFNVNINNPDAFSIAEQRLKERMLSLIDEFAAKLLQNEEADLDIEGEKQEFMEGYRDDRAIIGQRALDYITNDQMLHSKLCDGALHWLILGEITSYKNVIRDDVFYEIVNPIEMAFDPTAEWGEDGEYAVRRRFLSVSQVIAEYYDELTPEQVKELDKGYAMSALSMYYYDNDPALFEKNLNRVEVIHVTWKTLTEIQLVEYQDEFGETVVEIMPEEYKAKRNEKVTKYIVPQVFEGTRLKGDIYVRMRIVPAQRNKMNQLGECKLPYNKRNYSAVNSVSTSLFRLALPYQILYMIVLYTAELMLSKNTGKVLLIDKNVIPRKGGWDEEKWLYYAKSLGVMFVDRNAQGVDKQFNQYTYLDGSTLQDVFSLFQTLEFIENSLDKLFGYSPSRLGNLSDRTTTGAVERAITQSSMVTEELWRRYESFIQKELKGLLDVSKLAWREGKKASFVGSMGRTILLDIDPMNYSDSDYGVTVVNNSQDVDEMQQINQLVQPMANSGQIQPSTLVDIIATRSLTDLRRELKKVEKINQKLAAQQQEGEQQAQQQAIQIKMQLDQQLEQLRHELEMQELAFKFQHEKEMEFIKGDIALSTLPNTDDNNENGVPDINEVEKRAVEREKIYTENMNKQMEINLKKAELALRNKEIATNAAVKLHDSNTKLKIAKTNKNKYDK